MAFLRLPLLSSTSPWRFEDFQRVNGNDARLWSFRNQLVGVAALSVLIAGLGGGRLSFLAGTTYMLKAVVLTFHGMVMGKRRRKLEERSNLSANAGIGSNQA